MGSEGTQHQPGIEPITPLGQYWVTPIVAFYNQQELLRAYSPPEAPNMEPHRVRTLAGAIPTRNTNALSMLSTIKEGVLLRNISAAPICDNFTVGPPGHGTREVGLF